MESKVDSTTAFKMEQAGNSSGRCYSIPPTHRKINIMKKKPDFSGPSHQ